MTAALSSPSERMTAEPGWSFALTRAASSRIVLLLGDSDSGKTSLMTWLAASLASPDRPVAVVDADLGQSRIGPPTTVGLGRVTGPIQSLTEAEVLALGWVGSFSPSAYVEPLAEASGQLVARAAADFSHVLVDTCGLVRDARGAALKLAEIRRVAPDLVICLRRAGECDPVLRELAGAIRPEVLTLPVGSRARRVSQEQRRRRREAALDGYFAGGGASMVSFDDVGGLDDLDVPQDAANYMLGTLVGLFDDRGDTRGIGCIGSADVVRRQISIDTPVPRAHIARVELGVETFHPTRIVEVTR